MADWASKLNLAGLEEQHDLPSGLLNAVMQQESAGKPNAVSPKGARGLFQLMPNTAAQYGVDPENPIQAARAAAKMYGELFRKYGGDIEKALAGYNWGQGNVDRKGMARISGETRDYIQKVKANMGTSAGRDLSGDLFGSGTQAPPAAAPRKENPAPQAGRDLTADLFGGSSAPRTAGEVKLNPKMSDDDIIRSFGYDPKVIKASGQYKPGSLQGVITDPEGWFAKNIGDSAVGGFLRGIRDPIDAGAQLVTRGLEKVGLQSKADVAYVELLNKIAEADYQQNWRHGGKIDPETGDSKFEVSRLAGNVVVPVKGAGLIKGTGTAVNVARAATAGAIAAGTQQQVLNTSPDVGGQADDYWTEKGKQTATGAVLGPIAQQLLKGGTTLVAKGVNAVKGRLQSGAQEVIDQAAKHDVPVTYGDVSRGPIASKAEVALESIPGPLGTATFREGQQVAAKTAAGNVAQDLRDRMINAGFRGVKDIDAAAASGNKVAIALKNEIANAGDDWNKIIQTSGNVKAFRSKLIADKMYDKVEQLANQAGDVPLNKTQQAVDDALKEVTASRLPDQELTNLLQRIKDGLADTTKDASYTGARRLRSDLGALMDDYYKGANSVVGQKGVGFLSQIKSAVEQDMGDFIQQSGSRDLQQAANRADRFYKTSVVPYKDRALAMALKDAHPDEVYGKFIQQGKGERAQTFLDALDEKGKAAVKYGMVTTAIDKATNETTGVFSPAKFAASLEKVKEARGALFKGQDKWELDGFTKLMRHVERAGQYAENPPTGQRVIPWLIGGAATLNPATAAKAAGVAATAKLMFTTEAGKRYLLAASDLQVGSPAMQKLLGRIEKDMPAVAAKAATQEQQPTKEQE